MGKFAFVRGLGGQGYPGYWSAGRFWSNGGTAVEIVQGDDDPEPEADEESIVVNLSSVNPDTKVVTPVSRKVSARRIGQNSFKILQYERDQGRLSIEQGEARSIKEFQDGKSTPTDSTALEEENRRLRAELAKATGKPIPQDDATKSGEARTADLDTRAVKHDETHTLTRKGK